VSAYARVIWEQPPVERAKLSHLPSLPSTITTAAHIRRFCVYCRRWVAPFIHLHTLHKSSGKLRLHIMTGTWEGLFVLPAVARPRSSPCFFVLLLQRHRRTASRLGGNLAQHSKVFCPSFRKRRLISWYTQRESSDYRSLTAVRFRYILSDIKKKPGNSIGWPNSTCSGKWDGPYNTSYYIYCSSQCNTPSDSPSNVVATPLNQYISYPSRPTTQILGHHLVLATGQTMLAYAE